MTSKTDDIESAIGQALRDGPLTLAAMEARLPDPLREASFDRRWIGAAVYKMLGDGRLWALACDAGHSHDSECVVELGPTDRDGLARHLYAAEPCGPDVRLTAAERSAGAEEWDADGVKPQDVADCYARADRMIRRWELAR